MHILFVTGEYPPLSGGVGAYTAALAHALAAAGAHVSVLTAARAAGAARAADSAGAAGVTVQPLVKRWGPSIWRTIPALAQRMGADWVHVQYQTAAFAMNPAINLLPGRSPVRVAWTYHDLLVPYLLPKAGARLRNWITARPAAHAELVIVTNDGDRAQLRARLPGLTNLHTIPIGSNIAGVTLDAAARAALRAAYGYSPGTLLLGYFGFLNRSKGGDTLIGALDALVRRGLDAHLLMVGDRLGASDPTNAATLAEIEALIAARGLHARVRWTGRLDDADASAALNAVDLLLLPYADGASLRRGTLMAGLANGCAIVTTQPAHNLPELVAGRDLLYTPPGDAAALAAAAAALAADAPRRAQIGAAARAAAQQFTWATIAQRHLALYAGGA